MRGSCPPIIAILDLHSAHPYSLLIGFNSASRAPGSGDIGGFRRLGKSSPGGVIMNINDLVIQEARDLSLPKAREVLDFILFLKQKDEQAFIDRAAETSLGRLWNSAEEDEAWKDL